MSSISSATNRTSGQPRTSAGDLADMLKGVSAFVSEHGPEWMVGAVEEAIARISVAPRGTYKDRMDPARMEAMLRAGASYKDLSAAFGVPRYSICNYVRLWGLVGIKPRKKSVPTSGAPSRPWCESEDLLLKDMWERGFSCSDIAAGLSCRTRNMVIGRVHRLGLPSRPSPIKRAA